MWKQYDGDQKLGVRLKAILAAGVGVSLAAMGYGIWGLNCEMIQAFVVCEGRLAESVAKLALTPLLGSGRPNCASNQDPRTPPAPWLSFRVHT